ncbi:MAG: STAS domain-containing protein [Bacteroidales bacterium]|nr:STAS domain-containing protein [Bacteroidales bacterium]
MINISYNAKDQIMSCVFTGHLGADHSAEIIDAINIKTKEVKNADNPPDALKIIFDLGKVEFIASSFIRICISTFKDVGKGNFSIINTKPIIKKTFAIAGLSDDMNIK